MRVALAFGWAPAGFAVNVGAHIDDLEGGKKTVFNALPQAVGVDRLAEVVDIGNVLGFLGRGGHAKLGGGRKIFQYFAPGAVALGGTPVAFVYDNQVEKIRGKKPGKTARGFAFFAAVRYIVARAVGKLLVEREIDFVGGRRGRVVFGEVDFVDGFFQRREVLLNGLVNQDVAVGKVEDAPHHAAFQQPPDNLKGGVGFAGAGRHDQQKALLPASNRLYHAVDGDALVVARGVGVLAGVPGLRLYLLFGFGEAALAALAQFVGRGEGAQGEFALFAGEKVVLEKGFAVGTIRKGQIEHLGVSHGLLQAVADGASGVLGFDYGNGTVGGEVQQVIRPFRCASHTQVAAQVDFAVGNLRFHPDLLVTPTCIFDGGRNEPGFDVFFAQLCVIHRRHAFHKTNRVIPIRAISANGSI